jgi:DNA-binding Xre family transcriptional regulator
MKDNSKQLAEDLKVILVRKQSNISDLAKRMDVSAATMYSKFNRGNFSIKDLDSICNALGISYKIEFEMNEEA